MHGHTSLATLTAGLCLMGSLVITACSDDESNTTASTISGPGSGGSGATGPGNGGSGATGGTSGPGGSGAAGGGGSAPVPQNQFLYVANQNDDTISTYTIADNGELMLGENQTVQAAGPGPLAVTPDQTRLYVASVSGRAISAFDIDQNTGELTPIGNPVTVAPRPVYIAIDHTGGYLLLASYGDNVAESYALNGDGTLNDTPIDSHTGPGNNPHAIVLSPGNDFAFVPNTNPTPETISQFVFNAGTGALTPNATATVDASGAIPVGPRHLTFHPTLDILYVVNEHSDSVTAYSFDPGDGTLTEGATTTTLVGGPSGGNTCADIHITPDGSALYASNRGDNSLAMFTVDAAGALTANGHIDTGEIPREFEVTRDGRFVYVANQDSDTLNVFDVGTDGTLTPGATPLYAVGDRPMWVLALSVDQP